RRRRHGCWRRKWGRRNPRRADRRWRRSRLRNRGWSSWLYLHPGATGVGHDHEKQELGGQQEAAGKDQAPRDPSFFFDGIARSLHGRHLIQNDCLISNSSVRPTLGKSKPPKPGSECRSSSRLRTFAISTSAPSPSHGCSRKLLSVKSTSA